MGSTVTHITVRIGGEGKKVLWSFICHSRYVWRSQMSIFLMIVPLYFTLHIGKIMSSETSPTWEIFQHNDKRLNNKNYKTACQKYTLWNHWTNIQTTDYLFKSLSINK